MPTKWEIDVHIKLNALTQSESQTFCDSSIAVQNVNSLARCTHVHDKKLHLTVKFQPWLDALKELNTDLQAECASVVWRWKQWWSPCNTNCIMTVLSWIPIVNAILPPPPQNPYPLQMHLPTLAQKITLPNSHLRRVLFLSITMVAQNATSYMSFTPYFITPMTFQRALATKPSPRLGLTLHDMPMKAKWRKWSAPPIQLDTLQTTCQWSSPTMRMKMNLILQRFMVSLLQSLRTLITSHWTPWTCCRFGVCSSNDSAPHVLVYLCIHTWLATHTIQFLTRYWFASSNYLWTC